MRSAIFCFLFLFSLNAFSGVHDQCNDILSQGIYDIYRYNYTVEIKESLQKWAKNSSEGNKSLKASIADKFGIKTSSGKKKISEQFHDQRFHGTWATHVLMKYVNGDIVNAWKDCMKNKNRGFIYYSTEEYGEIKVYYEHRGVEYGSLSNVTVSVRNLEYTGGKQYPENVSIGSRYTHFYKRQSNDESSRFYFSGSGSYADIDFSIVIPPVEKVIVVPELDYYPYKGFKIYEDCMWWKNDIAHYGNVPTVESCADVCSRTGGCKAFTWFHDYNNCWLHRAAEGYRFSSVGFCGRL